MALPGRPGSPGTGNPVTGVVFPELRECALLTNYACISRKNTNDKEIAAETVISNLFVNLKVF
jgi:hypothetical protein